MNYFAGSISEAVSLSKSKGAIFVVFVEGTDESSVKINEFMNTSAVRERLENDDFVAIKIKSNEEAYIQFASIYQVVPVPSVFFIGKNGTPLVIVTNLITALNDFLRCITTALGLHKDKPLTQSQTFIANEQNAAAAAKPAEATKAAGEIEVKATKTTVDQPSTSQSNVTIPQTNTNESTKPQPKQENITNPSPPPNTKVVCDGDVCKLVPNENPSASSSESRISVEERKNEEARERMRKILEERRRERILEEQKLEKERELKRREESKAAQNLRDWQRDNEMKELKQTIKREKLAEQEARERIRAQIQADRAERAQKNAMEMQSAPGAAAGLQNALPADQQPKQSAAKQVNSDTTRLQFRLPLGDVKMNVFKINQSLGEVRSYVKTELLANTGTRDFYLATSYPRKEFKVEDDDRTLSELGLIPNGVILVIAKESKLSPAGIISGSGGIINLVTGLVQMLCSPFFSAFEYLRSMFLKRPAAGGNNQDDAVPRRRRFVDINDPNADATASGSAAGGTASNDTKNQPNNQTDGKAYRRYGGSNIHRLTDNRKDSDDENATWNGNSTQQQ